MSIQLPSAGAVCHELACRVQQWWYEAAAKNNVNLEGFDPSASLRERIARALQLELLIATIYSRFSSKRQHSTDDQVRECIVWAAQHGIYVPPELICVDEAVKGKRIRRDGLDRMKEI